MRVDIKGTIVSDNDGWVYDWLKIPATYPGKIKGMLEQAKEQGEPVELVINSNGGVVNAAFEIVSELQEFKGDVKARIVCAMSAATLIACAADCVEMESGGMYMIHNTQIGGISGDYRAFEKTADALKQYNESILNIYEKKTGLSREKLQQLMDSDTHMTVARAMQFGFVDAEVSYDKTEKEKENIVAAHEGVFLLSKEKIDEMKKIINEKTITVSESDTVGLNKKEKEGKDETDMTLEEFLKGNPEAKAEMEKVTADAREKGVTAERERLQELDAIAKSVTAEVLADAKYGEKMMDAKELSFLAMKDDTLRATAYMKEAIKDAQASGSDNVGLSHNEDEEKNEADMISAYINKRRER